MAQRQQGRVAAARREVLAQHPPRDGLAPAAPDEAQYNLLESLASRAHEYERGAREGRAVREPEGRLVPTRARSAAVAAPADAAPALRGALAAALAAERDAQRALERRYPYDVLTRNCATELVRLLADGLGGEQGFRAALGGPLAPGEGLSFIPFALQDLVESRLAVARRERIPSYRERALAALRREHAGALALAREASPLTARVYRWRDRDTRFALFTSDVFWPRPLYGFVNLASALPDTLLGLATAPFDGARRVRRGAWGALYSLPELAFFNIRKGTFDAGTLPPEVTPEADAAALAGR